MLRLEDLQKLAETHADTLTLPVKEFDMGGEHFAFNTRSYFMGVINLSHDSWYRESVCLTPEQAIQRGRLLRMKGAHLVDIGAESSLPKATLVEATDQLGHLLPVIRGLIKEKILVSAETYHPKVAEACLDAGASVLNLTCSANTEEIFRIAAERQATVILCYVEGDDVRSVGEFSLKEDMIPKMHDYFSRKIDEASRLGVTRVLIDPGLGFYYKNLQDSAIRVRHQMKIFLNTFRLKKLGYPICHALPHAFEYFGEQVRSAESFFAVLALLGKTHLLRTHEIERIVGVSKTLEVW